MDECCYTCRYRKKLVKFDYSQGGCEHTDQEGFACLAPDLVSEGQVTWMVGLTDLSGSQCECYERSK